MNSVDHFRSLGIEINGQMTYFGKFRRQICDWIPGELSAWFDLRDLALVMPCPSFCIFEQISPSWDHTSFKLEQRPCFDGVMMPKPGENLDKALNAWSSAQNWALRRHARGLNPTEGAWRQPAARRAASSESGRVQQSAKENSNVQVSKCQIRDFITTITV